MFNLDIILYMEALQADIIGYLRLRNLFQQLSCLFFLFCGLVPWLYQYWPRGFMVFVVLCPGTSEGSNGSGSGFKASQKMGQWLKVLSDRLEKPGIEPVTPGLQDIALSPTPRRLLNVLKCLSFWCQLHFKATASLQSHSFKKVFFFINQNLFSKITH